MDFRLLRAFQRTFDGVRYLHRNPSLGNRVAQYLFEDLFEIAKSDRLRNRIAEFQLVINAQNLATGVRARRGDGTLGERVGDKTITDLGFSVARGHIANVQIGVEVKILAQAMIKQIDRVISDLRHQSDEFRTSGKNAIAVGIIGINCAGRYTSYEGTRVWNTDGKTRPHPKQECEKAAARMLAEARKNFDELLLLKFRASNQSPYEFEWCDYKSTSLEYEAILVRISREYDRRFP